MEDKTHQGYHMGAAVVMGEGKQMRKFTSGWEVTGDLFPGIECYPAVS